MGIVKKIVIFVLLVSFLTFVAFFGRLPAFRYALHLSQYDGMLKSSSNTPIGALHRVIWIHIPRGFASLDRMITGGRLGSGFSRLGNYLFYSKHPIVMVQTS